jgi:TnpA family transposase
VNRLGSQDLSGAHCLSWARCGSKRGSSKQFGGSTHRHPNYINDPEMRRLIQAATCKSEEFNQFVSWIRFGGGGVISDNMRPNQRKIIRFNHLLANILIFHTVVYQTKAINKLRGLGTEIPNEILSGISPYWTEHLNRFGVFQLDMQKMMAEIEYDLVNSEI